ncbi:polymeric immunoglobulin receptor-like, partial [Sinocyclocheilus grahami]|uniref:polymeric immunoglobulin receptor-like n=1 Tax=Sinocyclocheilus grahami TaxID=75366 RepID=UPI0007ACCC80
MTAATTITTIFITLCLISVKDDTALNLFTVTMTELRAEDAGKYWCAVKDAFNLPIELMIITKDAVTHEASVGGSASISCKHIRNQAQGLFCRGDQLNICVRDGVHVSSNNRTNGRFSLTEETSAGVFTVKISNLRAEDSGKYWCAEESSGSFIFTEVQLHVTGGFSVTAAVSVGLILLAVCLVLVLFKIKHCSKHDFVSSDRRETGDHEAAQEEIQVSDPESTHLYATVRSSTSPSDGLLYAAVRFQKHEESPSDAT